jgi:hypothetical protein
MNRVLLYPGDEGRGGDRVLAGAFEDHYRRLRKGDEVRSWQQAQAGLASGYVREFRIERLLLEWAAETSRPDVSTAVPERWTYPLFGRLASTFTTQIPGSRASWTSRGEGDPPPRPVRAHVPARVRARETLPAPRGVSLRVEGARGRPAEVRERPGQIVTPQLFEPCSDSRSRPRDRDGARVRWDRARGQRSRFRRLGGSIVFG